MTLNSLMHLTDDELVRSIRSLLVRDSKHTAVLIARLAEVDRRKLYRPAGYSAMYLYCVHELGMSEAVAYKRTRAARVVRRFPVVLAAIAEGRLHLDAVKLLSKHLRRHNVESLIAAAAHRTSREVRALIAERFPIPDLPTSLRPMLPRPHAPALRTDVPLTERVTSPDEAPAPAYEVTQSSELAARPVQDIPLNIPALSMGSLRAEPPTYPRVTPTSPGRFALEVTLNERTHDLLRRAQELLGQASAAGGIPRVLECALEDLVEKLEYQKFVTTDSPRARRSAGEARYIPADIKRRVAERDGYQCAFVSATGHRCDERSDLEFDHVQPVARGGRTTVENLRLLCPAHNQFEAERVYGEGFMRGKREAAGHVATCVRERAPAYEPLAGTHFAMLVPTRTKARASWRRGPRVSRLRTWRRLRPASSAAKCRGRESR